MIYELSIPSLVINYFIVLELCSLINWMAANVWSSCYDFCFALPNVLKLLNHDFDHNTLSAIVLG